jgi:hypothetical protein
MFTVKSEVISPLYWVKILFNVLTKIFLIFAEPLCEFPQISRTLLYEVITVWPGCHKFSTRWVQKILKTQKMASALTFFRAILQRWQWTSQSHRKSDETWVSLVNVETKMHPNQLMNTHPPNKRIVLTESWRKLFSGTEKSADGGIHATRDHNNVRSLCEILKKQYNSSHSSTAGAFQLGVVWPPSL